MLIISLGIIISSFLPKLYYSLHLHLFESCYPSVSTHAAGVAKSCDLCVWKRNLLVSIIHYMKTPVIGCTNLNNFFRC